MDHRLSEFLRARFALPMSDSDFMRCAIVLDYTRVIHREIGGALAEVGNWIASRAH